MPNASLKKELKKYYGCIGNPVYVPLVLVIRAFGYVPTLGWNFQANASVHVLEWRDLYHMILTSFCKNQDCLKIAGHLVYLCKLE